MGKYRRSPLTPLVLVPNVQLIGGKGTYLIVGIYAALRKIMLVSNIKKHTLFGF